MDNIRDYGIEGYCNGVDL